MTISKRSALQCCRAQVLDRLALRKLKFGQQPIPSERPGVSLSGFGQVSRPEAAYFKCHTKMQGQASWRGFQ